MTYIVLYLKLFFKWFINHKQICLYKNKNMKEPLSVVIIILCTIAIVLLVFISYAIYYDYLDRVDNSSMRVDDVIVKNHYIYDPCSYANTYPAHAVILEVDSISRLISLSAPLLYMRSTDRLACIEEDMGVPSLKEDSKNNGGERVKNRIALREKGILEQAMQVIMELEIHNNATKEWEFNIVYYPNNAQIPSQHNSNLRMVDQSFWLELNAELKRCLSNRWIWRIVIMRHYYVAFFVKKFSCYLAFK